MTPKDRARELVNQMKLQMRGPGIEAAEGNAKRCALTAVDLLLDTVDLEGFNEYWNKVKTELLNL